MTMRVSHAHARPPARQRGVTLIVALVMLVVVGLTSVAVMRNAMSTDQVANNARVQTLAMQAAQIGLRYCESPVYALPATPPFTIYDAPVSPATMRWESFSNWFGSGAIAYTIPLDQMQSSNSAFTPTKRPQCIVQRSTLTSTYVVTVRGFSPDYAEDSSGRAKAGSVVWLQSILTAGP